MDWTMKNLIKIFNECGLPTVCKINLKSVDFLFVRFDMQQETYTPMTLYASTNIQVIQKL